MPLFLFDKEYCNSESLCYTDTRQVYQIGRMQLSQKWISLVVKGGIDMVNNIRNQQLLSYQKSLFNRKNEGADKQKAQEEKDPMAQYGADTQVELSADGRAAYEMQVKAVKAFVEENGGNAEQKSPELSSKAQDLLGRLQDQYGEKYDFFVVDTEEDLRNFKGQGTKGYSVVFTKDELERMANDEEYAKKVMDTVDSIVGMTKKMEENGELGEGVKLKSVMISVGEDGNVKLFAQLEKMSEEQEERLEKAKEKKAEERKAEQEDEEEVKASPVKWAQVEAGSVDELLQNILALDWEKIAEQKENKE